MKIFKEVVHTKTREVINQEFLPRTTRTYCSKSKSTSVQIREVYGFLFLFILSFLMIGCSDDPNDPYIPPAGEGYVKSAMPEMLKGTWVGTLYHDTYIIDIDNTTFTSEDTYEGKIVGHRNKGNAGYITIQFTSHIYNSASVDQFYIIHYKDLTETTMAIAGAYHEDDPAFALDENYNALGSGGKTTQALAEAVMTVSAGYFGMYSTVTKEDAEEDE